MEELRLVAGALMAGLGAVGGAIGVGVAASKYLEGIARQPELQGYLSVSYTHLTLPTNREV